MFSVYLIGVLIGVSFDVPPSPLDDFPGDLVLGRTFRSIFCWFELYMYDSSDNL